MTKKLDLTGHTYNLLTVVEEASKSLGGRVHWVCRCACGITVTVASNNLRNGHTKSCGCHKSAKWAEIITTHGLSRKHPDEYKIWKGMRSRCYDTGYKNYDRYGGRGVTIDGTWEDFDVFFKDMGPRPGPGYSVERKDNDGPYAPGNCMWATRKVQANNRSSNCIVYAFGEKLTLSQAVQKYSSPLGIKYATVQARLARGWSMEDALTAPVKMTPPKPVTS